MKIPRLDGKRGCKFVMWDTACSCVLVRIEHAERMNFPSQEKRLHVRTLGGVMKEIDSRIYIRQIKDWDGTIYEFMAHGLDKVTREIGDGPSRDVLQKLFPRVQNMGNMMGSQDVDYLIGLGKASWHPYRYERAHCRGDLCRGGGIMSLVPA